MQVSEAMTRNVKTARQDWTLKEAVAEMNKYRISSLVVASGSGEAIGILTERDLMRAMESDARASEIKVQDAMTKKNKLILIEQTATLEEAADAMTKYKVKKLPVVDEGENLVGIITATDLIKHRNEVAEKFVELVGLKQKEQAGTAG